MQRKKSDAAGARSLQVLRAARERGPDRQSARAQLATLLPEQPVLYSSLV